jgi:6-carboxyhexanoate--CoA ligase
MRASRLAGKRKSGGVTKESIHISGAEGLYGGSDIRKVLGEYASRAINHSRGMPDEIVITVERLLQAPLAVPLLPVATFSCSSPEEARMLIMALLKDSGVSARAIERGIRITAEGKGMRGAALLRAGSGDRVESDRVRGIRVSRIGTDEAAGRRLSRRLARQGINTPTVKEALTLASKVASCAGVVAEICVSDDPHYTTGYVASRSLGYVRIPNIKRRGSMSGGRVFFIDEGIAVDKVADYLEKTPVIVGA